MKDKVVIALSTDDKYVPYMMVTIQSIIEKANREICYELIILSAEITVQHQKEIEDYIVNYPFMRIHFLNPRPYLYDKQGRFKIDLSNTNYNENCCYKIVLPELLKGYNKALFMDSDLVVLEDIAELYNQDIEKMYLAACVDMGNVLAYVKQNDYICYHFDVNLRLKDPHNYFNTGVMLINLKEMREHCTIQKIAEKSKEIKAIFPEQDILNVLCEDKIKLMDMKWNVLINVDEGDTEDFGVDIKKAKSQPFVVHYAGQPRPWNEPAQTNKEYTNIYWNYARNSLYYNELVRRQQHYEKQEKRKKNPCIKMISRVCNKIQRIMKR